VRLAVLVLPNLGGTRVGEDYWLPESDYLNFNERTGYDPADFATQKKSFTEQVLAQKRQQFWAAYLQALQERSSVQVYQDALRRLTG